MTYEQSTETSNPIQRAIRFSLPFWASVIVAGVDDSETLELLNREQRAGIRFPQAPRSGPSSDMIEELEDLRRHGWDYLLVPAAAFGWLSEQRELGKHLEREYRVVCSEDACMIVGLCESNRVHSTPAPDGLPIPPPEMVGLVGGTMVAESFYETGAQDTRWISDMVRENAVAVEDFEAILDFGCGCGRVIRHWRGLTTARLHGTDYNPYMIEWCLANLPFAVFEVNSFERGICDEDEVFDFIYGISVFTHLRESLQARWMSELTRVLRPGGLLLLTLHGKTRVDWLDPEEARRFESGELVVRASELSGSDFCAAWHPERYVRKTLSRGLKILDYSPGGSRDGQQDAVLFLKP